MSYLEDNARTGRVVLPDLVRAFALLGIVLVNVAYIAYPGELTYHAGGLNTGLDEATYFLVLSFFLFKSYTLFSFMFGVGMAYQIVSAERHGVSFGASYFRRMLGLVILGVLHVTVAFSGDILIIYGFLGMILFLFRNRSQKVLVRVGIFLVVLQVIIGGGFALSLYSAERWAPEVIGQVAAEIEESGELANAIFTDGSFSQTVGRRWHDWRGMIQYVLPLQGPGVLAFFLFGLAAVRSGVLADPKAPLWSRSRRVYLPIGVLLSLLGAYVSLSSLGPMTSRELLGYTLLLLAAPFSTIGYIGLIAKWSEGPVTAVKAFVARGGTASLTAYLLQSLILSLIFYGYGLGLYQGPGAFACIAIAFATGVATISFASWWRARYKLGPMEILLRSWTYWGTGRTAASEK